MSIFDALDKKLKESMQKAASCNLEKNVDEKTDDSAAEIIDNLEGNSNIAGGKDDILVPESAPNIKNVPEEDANLVEKMVGGENTLGGGDILVPVTDKEEIKKAFLDIKKLVAGVREKNANLEDSEQKFKESAIVKAASALLGAINVMDEMELKEKKASMAMDAMEIIGTDSYTEALKEVEKIASRLDGDMDAVGVYFNRVKTANELASSNGLTDVPVTLDESAYNKMREFLDN